MSITYNFFKVFLLIIFILYSFLKINPDIVAYNFFSFHEFGNLNRYIANVINEVNLRTLNDSKYQFIPLWQEINPGLFYIIAKFFIFFKLKYSYIQIFHIFFHFCGLMFFYQNIKKLFSNIVAEVSCILLIISPFFIFYSGTIHETLLNFFFINLFIFCFLKYLENSKKFFLVFITIFLACSNYWVNYIFIQIFLFYFLFYKKKNFKNLLILLTPLITFIFYISISIHYSDLENILSKFVGRTYDIKFGSNFSDIDKILTIEKLILYPAYIDHRIRTMLNIGILEILILFSLIKINKINIKNKNLILVLLICSLSWYIFFFQHSIIHRYSGKYAYFGIIVTYSIFCIEIFKFLKINDFFRKKFLSTLIFFFIIFFHFLHFSLKSNQFFFNSYNAHIMIKKELQKICTNNNKQNLNLGDLNKKFENSKISNYYNFKIYEIMNVKKNC